MTILKIGAGWILGSALELQMDKDKFRSVGSSHIQNWSASVTHPKVLVTTGLIWLRG